MYIADFARNSARNSLRRIIALFRHALHVGPEWEIHTPAFYEDVPKTSLRSHRTMRRKVNGQWQYRAPTDEELSEHDAGRAW